MRQWLRIVFPKTQADRQKRAGFLFVLPALLFFGSVFIVPLAQSIVYSFYKISPGGASEFVGLRLYEKVLTDSTFWTAVLNTIQLLLFSVPTTVVLALAVALGLNRITNLKWRNVWASMYFLPFASLVAAASSGNGSDPVYGFSTMRCRSSALHPRSGCRVCSRCAGHRRYKRLVRIGFDTMIFLAALNPSRTSITRAARIDGANAFKNSGTSRCPCSTRKSSWSAFSSSFSTSRSRPVYATTQGGPASASRPSSCCRTTRPSNSSIRHALSWRYCVHTPAPACDGECQPVSTEDPF